MRKLLLLIILSAYLASVFALSSSTNTAIFSLDTLDPDITIHSPNGGEEWYIGDTNDILWSITESNLAPNSVFLYYNRGGLIDVPLAEGIENLGTFAWAMPDTLGSNYRVRIAATDTFGNSSLKSSAATFTITYVPPETPEGVSVDISNAVDAVISWDAVTETIYGSPIEPDGYIVLYNESPYEHDEHYYYYLWDVTDGTSFTHSGVARRRDQMYYRVVAYKDIDGRMERILAEAKTNPEKKVSLSEIKDQMNGGVK